MEDMFHIQVKDKIFSEDRLECFATEILDAKYEKTDVAEVMKGLTHLNAHQKADLLWVLQENDKTFNGTLGVYPHKKVHIDIDPNAKPVHSRPYPVPWIHLKNFKKELIHLVKIGVLAAQQESEWVSPSFIIPKKDLPVAAIRRGENDETQGATTCFIWLNCLWNIVSRVYKLWAVRKPTSVCMAL